MAPIAKKVQGGTADPLHRFVAENLEGLEPGLSLLETSLRLGRSTVDLVAVDGKQSLVLIAVAEVADVKLLLNALDAYIWCLAFPDNVRRLYPDAAIAPARPPRLVFVATEMPAAFLELVERLSVISLECHQLATTAERPEELAAPETDATRPSVATAEPHPSTIDVPAEPEPQPGATTQLAGCLSGGFDAAVARQWERFLGDVSMATPEPDAGETAVTAGSPAGKLIRSAHGTTSNRHRRNGQTSAPHPVLPPVSNGHGGNAHSTNGDPKHGRQPSAEAAQFAPLEHAAVDLGPRVEIAPALSTAALITASADAGPVTPRPAHEETRTVNHPALQALRFPKSGVSRQWQEFLDQLATNQ
jgi:hypothetical protein